jgi:hypothetical protein
MRAYEEVLRFAPGSFAPLPSSSATGMGDVSPDGARYFTFSPNEAAGGSDFAAYVMDAEPGSSRHVLFNGDTYVSLPNGLTVTPDGRYVIVGTVTRYTHVYDASSFRELFRLDVGDQYSSAFDPETDRLYTSSADEGVKVWDLGSDTTGVDSTLDLGSYPFVNGDAFFPGDSIVAMNTIEPSARRWAVQAFNPSTGGRVGETLDDPLRAASGGIAVHSPLPGGRFVLVHIPGPPVLEDGSYGADHLIWDPVTGTTIDLIACDQIALDEFGDAYCDGPDEPKWYWYVVPDDGSELWAFGSSVPFDWEFSGDVVVLDPETGEVVEESTIEEWDGFHPDIDPRAVRMVTDTWTVGDDPDGLIAQDRSTGEVLWRLDGGAKLEVSPSRRRVLGQSSGVVHVVETETWSEVAAFEVPGQARGTAFSLDETMVAVGTLDATYVIDLATGLAVRQVNLAGVSDFVWIDDETVIIGTNDGLFGILSLSTDDFLHATRANLRRSFTDDECQRYDIDPCPTLEELRGES